MDEFQAALTASPLGDPDQWDGRSVDDLAQLADDFAPIKKVTRRP